jgi:hypothetical protein
MERDDTTRGKIRRVVYKVYLKLNTYFTYFIDLMVVYSTKLSLLVLFCVAI